jgi:predicted exporter
MIKMLQTGKFAIIVWLIFLLFCGYIVSRTQLTTDLSAFLPKTPTPEQQLLMDQIQDGLASRLILVGIEGEDTATRAQLSKLTAKRLRSNSAFITVNNGEPIYTENDQAFLFNHRYLLSPAINANRFSVSGLHDAIEESIGLLASPAGLMVKSMLPRDPTGEMMQLLDQFNNMRQPELAEEVWASKDGHRALMLIQTKALGSDTDAQQRAMQSIQQAFDEASQVVHHASSQAELNAKLVMTGPGVFSVNARDTIKNQVFRLSMISIVLITALLLLVYRSFSALFLGLLPVLTGAIAGVAAVSLSFGMIHGITLGFGTALIGEAVDYSIYLFVQSESGKASHQHWVKRFWPTIRLGVMTSVCGFASLLFSGFPGLAQLGVYAIAGLITAAIVTRFVLPHLLPATFRIHDTSAIGQMLSNLAQQAYKLRWPAILLLIFSCATVFSHRADLWSQNISSLSPVSQADIALDTELRADVGAPDVRYMVVVSGDSREAVLQSSEQVSALLQAQVNQGNIASFESPSRYLPSEATQRERQASLPDANELKANLSKAVSDLPIQTQKLAPFIEEIMQAKQQPLLQPSQLDNTSMAMALDALLLQQGSKWSALLPLTAHKNTEINADKIRQVLTSAHLDNVVFIDMKAESDNLYSGYMEEAISHSLMGLAAIIVLLLVVFKSIPYLLRVIAPLAAAVITVTAGLVLLGQQLIILHLVGMLLVVAVGSNYALLFNQPNASARTLASMLFANLTTVIGFGILAFSNVSILQALGSTVAPGVILALIFSIIFAKKFNA